MSEISNSMDVLLQEEKYTSYILEHQRNVFKAFSKLFKEESINKIFSNAQTEYRNHFIDSLLEDISNHDESKFSDEEFEGYRLHFYPTDEEKDRKRSEDDNRLMEEKFNESWKHHYMNNDHHPFYWQYHKYEKIDDKMVIVECEKLDVPTDMTLKSILHMICDWEAMSIKFNSSTIEWYNTKADKEKNAMSEKTRKRVEYILSILYNTKIDNSINEDK